MKTIPLTQGCTTTVDDADFEVLNHFKWFAKFGGNGGGPYAARTVFYGIINGKRKTGTVRMHRQIMDCPADREIDHKDGNPLNNQRSNLQIVDKSTNIKGRYRRPPPEYSQDIINQNVA